MIEVTVKVPHHVLNLVEIGHTAVEISQFFPFSPCNVKTHWMMALSMALTVILLIYMK